MKVNVIFAILLAAVTLLFSMTTSALAMGSQLWYLDSETTVAGYKMEKETGPGNNGQTGNVTIAANRSVVWIADQAAVSDVTISGGIWKIKLYTLTYIEDEDLDARIGYYDGNFNEIETWGKSIVTGHALIQWEFQVDPATIEEGHYLALQIINNDSEDHVILTGEKGPSGYARSCLKSPDSDPGYPLPELSSAIILGAGLIGLVGYLGIRRRKASV